MPRVKEKESVAVSKKKLSTAAASKSKIESFTITIRSLREMAQKEAKLVQCALRDMEDNLIDPKYILELTKSIRGTEEKSITKYIEQNTEILLNEHASVIRQQVIENMKKQMQEMNNELTQNTQKLESDISNFFELIELSYESTSDSFQKVVCLAEENCKEEELIDETKEKLHFIESDVQKLETQLLECLMCYAFLNSLFSDSQKGKSLDLPKNFLISFGPSFDLETAKEIQKKVIEDIISSGEDSEPFEVHIKSREDIVRVIDRVKNSNLSQVQSLIRNRHQSKGSLESERQELDETKKKIDEQILSYDAKIADLKKEIEKAEAVQEKLQKQLKAMQEERPVKETSERENEMKNLAELYSLCTGSDTKTVDIFLMKSSIDFCLENLFHELNKHPKRKIKEIIKNLESEKKQKERKMEEALRAERLKKRLERDSKHVKNF